MPYPCFMVGESDKKTVGAMWYAPEMLEAEFYLGYSLSNEYKRDWMDKRPPIWVVLPSGTWFCVDSQITDGDGSGWVVTGEAPNITVSPSINCVGIYHGFLQNGVLSDDCEGRIFRGKA